MVDTHVDTIGAHGPAVDAVTADMMVERRKLIPLAEARAVLAATEPLGTVNFETGDRVRFRLEPGWNHGVDDTEGTAAVEAFMRLDDKEYQMSKDALLEATSFCGITKHYASHCPPHLIEPQLNYWFREGLSGREFKMLTVGGDHAAAFTKRTITPFSNLALLDQALDGIAAAYGTDARDGVLVDYKFHHTLRRTSLRLVVPEKVRTLQTPREDDRWSLGINLGNSLIGEGPTHLDGYLFAWWCTNGAIDVARSSGSWSRRTQGQGDDVFQWARNAVDDILGGLEHSLDAVQDLVNIPVEGEVNDVLRDVFNQYKVPLAAREQIIENMVESNDLTMYGVMQAITAAANTIDLGHETVASLMKIGGDLPRAAHDRCDGCRRILPPGSKPAVEEVPS